MDYNVEKIITMKLQSYIFSLLLIILTAQSILAKSSISLVDLKVEYKRTPFIDQSQPRLSWGLTSEGFAQKQTAYRILVASSEELLAENKADLWDSKKVDDARNIQVEYAGKDLLSRKKAFWKVQIWDQLGQLTEWSKVSFFELGLLNASDWSAQWIGCDLNMLNKNKELQLPPSPYLRTTSILKKPIKKARLYISSLGVHEFYINGNRIGKDYFPSGWTDYNKRVYYQVYDVTEDVKQGVNSFSAVLGAGWYAGYLGYALLVGAAKTYGFYGDFPLLKAQVEVEFTDGSSQRIHTDKSWKVGTGGILEADLLAGERFDASLEPTNWRLASFNDKHWDAVTVVSVERNLQLYPSQAVQVSDTLTAKKIYPRGEKKFIIDFGQNFAGIVQLINLKAPKGTVLQLRYGEMLNPDGSLMTENLRRARATDTYIFRGDSKGESWSPKFTYHGFQFVEVSGIHAPQELSFIKGLALSSNLEKVGSFETDNALLNQLYSNIVWTQKANYLDIPTDCPQRDERLAWTGDAQVYMRSALYNTDIAAFHTKWIQDLNDAQWDNGAYPIYAPMPKSPQGVAAIRAEDSFSPGWSDAGVICTYEIFKAYQDERIVRASMPFMKKYMDFLYTRSHGTYVLAEGAFEDISPKGGFGDWLSIGEKTSPDLLASFYYYYCARLMKEMALGISDYDLAANYEKISKRIKAAIKQHYIDKDGRFKIQNSRYGNAAGYVTEGSDSFSGFTQTAYANAIYMGLFEQADLDLAGKYLEDLVEKNDRKLSTGFLGFKPLLPALSSVGKSAQAYHLILSEAYPSLGFEVVNGATSIWERWDSYIKGEGFRHNAAMNSFSHYAFGSVNEWFFEHMGGIKNTSLAYKTIQIRPEIAPEKVNYASVKYQSIQGEIVSSWRKQGEKIIQIITVPVNVDAVIHIPSDVVQNVIVNGKPLNSQPLVKYLRKDNGYIQVQVGSGTYHIESQK